MFLLLRRSLSTGRAFGIVLACVIASGPAAATSDPQTVQDYRPGVWATPVDTSINLYQMSPTLYRSGMPSRQNVPVLQKLKLSTVVSFIKDNDAEWLRDAAVNRVSIPLHASRIDDEDVLRVLRIVREAETRGPVLIHCQHGRNRTGLMAAMYRTVIQGWSKDEALREMRQGGFGDMKDTNAAVRYVEKADIARIRQALANGECSTTPFSTCRVRAWFQRISSGAGTLTFSK